MDTKDFLFSGIQNIKQENESESNETLSAFNNEPSIVDELHIKEEIKSESDSDNSTSNEEIFLKTENENLLKEENKIINENDSPSVCSKTKGGGTSGTLHDELTQIRNTKRRNMEYILRHSTATPFIYQHERYTCFYCLEIFLDPDMLKEHTWENHKNENITWAIFKHMDTYKDVPFKIDITDISCKTCSEPMKNFDDLIQHLINIHDVNYHNVNNCFLQFRLINDRPTCGVCNEQFDIFSTLLQHANKEHLISYYECNVCEVGFPTRKHLQWHVNTYHKHGGIGCRVCDLNFMTANRRDVHEKNVHNANILSCPHCLLKFQSSYSKKIHLASKHGIGESKFKCPYCTQYFPTKNVMLLHMRTVHLKLKGIDCKICGAQFYGSYSFNLHMDKHTGDKRHVILVFGKKFNEQPTLIACEVTQSGIKYACELCSKGFARYANLKLHLKHKHAEYEIVEEKTVEYEEVSEDQLMEKEDDVIVIVVE